MTDRGDPRNNPTGQAQADLLRDGATILEGLLGPAGFVFQPGHHGKASGGPAATGRFVRGDQYVELHFRHSLGLVAYGWGKSVLAHADYLNGLEAKGAYPGFSDDPLDGFRHVSQDLAGPLAGFVAGDRSGYNVALQIAAQPRRRRLP